MLSKFQNNQFIPRVKYFVHAGATSWNVCEKPWCNAFKRTMWDCTCRAVVYFVVKVVLAFNNMNETLLQRRSKGVEHYSVLLWFCFLLQCYRKTNSGFKIWLFCFLQSKYEILYTSCFPKSKGVKYVWPTYLFS